MIKFAIYGKGGIGKSTIACNISAALAEKGLTVMQIGCDPKADSTSLLHGGERIPTVLDLTRKTGGKFTLDDVVQTTESGVLCVEAGGPVPGLGCAGRGIINALESLEKLGAYERFKPDVVVYDVLGDVVCGGFSMPMRKGYADKIFVVCSGEKMSRYAAANICMAVDNFKGRGYASLGGIILNRRGVPDEDKSAEELAADFDTKVIAAVDRSEDIPLAEEQGRAVINSAPDSLAAKQLRAVAESVYAVCGGE
ncbi:nitrogenase iron protein NifH [Ruminococcus sp.]|uniref:nitrogenase iron protein NifH n=1 Tax=Ruminococcus sp. TaxID=41978 RepID=UPI0025DFE5AC|nr:nitrogenase iron protein NifH [Ruminococcus sp.]MBQ8967715.1 AAA family ATPase [Ruminococcus sp.]